MTPKQRLLAYAQLLRLPNVFTAFADIGMAGAASGAITNHTDPWLLILAASGCLYLAGMVWNDYFDREEDAKTRPFRPIPSGRISPTAVKFIGCLLLIGGLVFAELADDRIGRANVPAPYSPSVFITILLAVTILTYDAWLKHTPFGPVGMGLCRALNVMLGISAVRSEVFGPVAFHLAAVVGVYIVGVTWFARTEEAASNRRQLVAAAGVMAAALGLAVTVPMHLPEGASPWYFPFLVVGFGFFIGMPIVAAIRRPEPKPVQVAVKRCILGLVVLDAVLATVFVGLPGLLILLLLPPALLLGKWVYST